MDYQYPSHQAEPSGDTSSSTPGSHLSTLRHLVETLKGGQWQHSVSIDPEWLQETLPDPTKLFPLGEAVSVAGAAAGAGNAQPLGYQGYLGYLESCHGAFSDYDQAVKSADQIALRRLLRRSGRGSKSSRVLPEYPSEFQFDTVLVFVTVCETLIVMYEMFERPVATPKFLPDVPTEDQKLKIKLDKYITRYLLRPGREAMQKAAVSALENEKRALLGI